MLLIKLLRGDLLVLAQKSLGRKTEALKKSCVGLRLGNKTRLDRLNRDPHALHFTTRKFYTNALNVWAETTSGVLNETGSDTTAFFGETLTDDDTTFDGAFTCDCANT